MITKSIIIWLTVTFGLGFSGNEPLYYTESIKAWKRAIIEHVQDEQREQTALELVAGCAEDVKRAQAEVARLVENFVEVDTRYDVTLQDYETIIVSLNAIWRENDKALVAKRSEIRNILTEEEWRLCLDDVAANALELKKKVERSLDQRFWPPNRTD